MNFFGTSLVLFTGIEVKKTRKLSEFHQSAQELLCTLWEKIMQVENIASARDKEWGAIFESVLFDGGNTYPYVLLTQVLGKATDGNLNALCLQDSSLLPNAWDARSLASKVVVGWNRDIGKALPGTNTDPYVNNPARYKNFGDEMESKAKNKTDYQRLVDVVSHIEERGQDEAIRLVESILIEIRFHLETNTRDYFGPPKVSLDDVMSVIESFLAVRSNGVRLQVVCYAVLKALSEAFPGYGTIQSYPTNSSDASGGRAGDVERINSAGKVDLAVEVKDRTVSMGDLEASILKCRTVDVRNLLFVIQSNPLLSEEAAMLERSKHEFTRGIDVNFSDAVSLFRTALMLLSPEQRAGLLRGVHDALEELGAHLKHRNHWMDLMKTI